ncbi:hypothetical protein D3C76_1615540 [compost metagenome]
MQGIDDFQADQAGTQAIGTQQFANLLVADSLLPAGLLALGRLGRCALGEHRGLRVVHVNAPFHGLSRNVGASLTRTNEIGKSAAFAKKKMHDRFP